MRRTFHRIRYGIRPDIRAWLDGFGTFVAITLFFCLIAAAHDGIVKRNKLFDEQRWWYPSYALVKSQTP